MENKTIIDEFDDMKAKLALLKEKLDKQKIVNETYLRNAIKGNIGKLNRGAICKMFLGCMATIYCGYITWVFGFSHYFTAFTVIMLLFCVAATYVQHKSLMRASDLSLDLMKETFDLMKLRKKYKNWFKIAAPLIIIWVLLLAYEATFIFPDKTMYMSCLFGILVGAFIGGMIGLKIHFKTLRQIENLLEQIEELKSCM